MGVNRIVWQVGATVYFVIKGETALKSKTYEEFVEKFKPKKTTDDCYTPPEIYETIKGWVCRKYGVSEGAIVRPFWPGANFTEYEYPEGCVVLDNPPFSILSKICEYFLCVSRRSSEFWITMPQKRRRYSIRQFRQRSGTTAGGCSPI